MSVLIPRVGVSKITGLLELLHDYKDKKDADEIASDLNLDLDEFLPVIKGSEMLGLVRVKDGQIILTDAGLELLSHSIPERKEHFKKIILSKTVLPKIVSHFGKNTNVKRKEFMEYLSKHFESDVNHYFNKIIEWGQYVEVLKYDRNDDEVLIY